jgi:hypothetical protein
VTAKKATTARKSSKASKTASKKASASASVSAKHTAHLEHEAHLAHLAHLAATGQKVTVKATPAKPATATKKVAFGAGDHLPVCGFEALAMSLRLAGQFVHDDDVAGLWDLAGADPLGASLAAALGAAGEHGLAGFRPRRVKPERLGPVGSQDHLPLPFGQDEAAALGPFEDFLAGHFHGLILRIDVPGPHAVLATADGWWSWGELYSPWPARVSEAWAVSWS